MKSFAFTTIPINPETIGLVFNIAFFVILGLIVIGFLIGLIRGVWKSGFRLIIVGGLVLAAFFAARPLTDMLATLDIGATLANFGVTIPTINLTLGEGTIVLNVTTLQATVESFFNQLFASMGMDAGSRTDTAALVMAITLVTLRYIVFIILGFLIITIGELLASLLYFFPFRLFIPKGWRKKHKVRLVGGLLNAVKVTLVAVMMMIPFSSIINTINQALHNDNNGVAEGIDDPTYNQIMAFMDAYNDSLFAQLLFNWSVAEDGRTIDAVLMDYVTSEDMDGYMLTLTNELYTITSIGQSVLSTGILTNGFTTATANALLSEDIMTSIIANVVGSTLVLKAVPIAITLALNMEVAQQYVDPDLVNIDDIIWEDELINVKDVALDVISSGVLDNILGQEGEINPLQIIVDMVSDEAYPHIRSALHRIDDSTFLSQVLPAVVYKLVSDEQATPPEGLSLATFFPTEWEDYQDLHFGEEIALIYDVIHNIAALDPDLLPAIFDVVIPTEPEPASLMDYEFVATDGGRVKTAKVPLVNEPLLQDAATDLLVDLVRAHSDELIEIIVGALDDDGLPIGVDPETSKTVLFDGEGNPLPGVTANLLDSGLLIYGLDEMMDMALEPLLSSLAGGQEFDRTKLDDALTSLNGTDNGEKRYNYKGEFGSILGIVSAIFANDALLSLIFPEEEPEPARLATPKGADEPADNDLLTLFEDEDFRASFKDDICPLLDRSQIMGAVIPSVLEGAFSGDAMSGMLDPLGLTGNDLNFDFDDVGTQMGILIDIIGFSLSVVDNMDTIFDDITPVVDDLIGLLDAIFTSDIFNPKDDDDLMTSENYYTLLSSIFGNADALSIDMDELDATARSVPDDGWVTTYDELGQPLVKGENYNLIKFIETALTSDLFDIDTEGDVMDQLIGFANDPDDPIGSIFDAVDSSIIISGTFGGVLDGLFGNSGGLVDPVLGTSFRNVNNWSTEGQNLKDTLVALDAFTSGIEDIDFMNDDPVLVENILKALARSQIFLTPDNKYVFSDFLLNKLKGDNSLLGDYLLDPYEAVADPSPYDIVTADFHAVGQTPATAANWYGDGGEIDDIIAFVASIQTFADGDPNPVDKLQNDPTITSADVKPILVSLNDVGSMRIMLYNLFDMMFGTAQFNVGSLTLSETNSYVLLELDDPADRLVEIDYAFDIHASLETMALNNGGTFDPANIDAATTEAMLNDMHDSRIFNTFDTSAEDRSHALGFLTVFEQVVEMIFDTSMMDSYIYKELGDDDLIDAALRADITDLDNNFADSLVLLDDWIGPNGEIKMITDIFVSFKDTGLTFADFGTDGANAISTLMDDSAGTAKVETLLLDINESRLAHPAIPNLFDEIFLSGAFAMSGVVLGDANTDYFRNESDKAERATEIVVLMDVYVGIDDLGITDGVPLDPTNIDALTIETMLGNLHDSKVFNTFQAGKSHATLDITVFEQTIWMLIDTSELDAYIYEGIGRDPALKEDVIAIGNDFAGTVPLNDDGWRDDGLVIGEITRIVDILDAFKSSGLTFDSFSGAGSNDVLSDLMDTNSTAVENMLLAMNRSQIVYPAIPNLYDNMLTSGSVGISGIDFTAANTHYRGNRGDPDDDDKYLPYGDAEISQMLVIYNDAKDLATVDYTDMTGIGITEIELIQDVANSLFESDVFHGTGASSGVADDPTVFEQIIIKMMNDTGVSDLINDNLNPNPEYWDGLVYKFATAAEKAEYLVVHFETLYGASADHHTNEWDGLTGEIEAYFRVFKEFKRIFPTLTTVDSLTPSALSPTDISEIMAVLNYSNLSADAIPDLVRDAFATISFGTYTEDNEDYYQTPVDYFSVDLTPMDYSTTDFTDLNPPTPGAMGIIEEVLDEFYDGAAYEDMGVGFDIGLFISGGHTTEPLLHLLDASLIFTNDVTVNYKTRSLTLYNILEPSDVVKYIDTDNPGTNKTSKVEKLETIFATDFDHVFEAERLDIYIEDLIDLNGLTDASSANGLGTQFRALIENTYVADITEAITDRAYLISELSAGFFTDIFEEEYAKAALPTPDTIDFYASDYANLNPKEADGVEGALSIIDEIDLILGGVFDDTDVARLQGHFVKMGSLLRTNVTGAYPTYDYSGYDIDGNSLIAKLFYAAEVVPSANYVNFSAALTLAALPEIIALNPDPYSANFVFEVEGDTIYYVYA